MKKGASLTIHRNYAALVPAGGVVSDDLPYDAAVWLRRLRKKQAADVHQIKDLLQHQRIAGQRPVGEDPCIKGEHDGSFLFRQPLSLKFPEIFIYQSVHNNLKFSGIWLP